MAKAKTPSLDSRIKQNLIFEESVKPPFPKDMLVELTNACNHKCMFCTNRKMTRKIGYIDEELLYRLMREAHALGTTDIGLYSTGEPFVSRNLAQYIETAKNIGFKYVYISSNGALATPKKAEQAIDAGLDSIKFSINAGTRDTYKQIHGRDDFEKVVDNLKFISDYRRRHNRSLKIFVTYIVTEQNESEIEPLKALIGSYVDEILFFKVINQGGMMPEIGELNQQNEVAEVKKPCRLLFNQLNITYEGYLTICCVDYQNYLVVADLKETSLIDAWHNDAFVAIRRKHLENDLQGTLCFNCLYNRNEKIEPLNGRYATVYDNETW